MASTETRTGFRLPWVSDTHGTTADPEPEAAAESESPAEEGGNEMHTAETGTADAATPIETDAGAAFFATPAHHAAVGAPEPATPPAPRRPTKFLADLARAMRSAAEAEREEILDRFRAEAKTFTETIHERSAVEATELRADADGDVDGIRQWSKAEIARIREETEHRITERHSLLERELEAHAARIERRIEHVQGTVEAFEGEMTRFFESLLAEEDPTRFAALAASLPEPPSLDSITADDVELPASVSAAPAEPEAVPVEPEAELVPAETEVATAETEVAPAEAQGLEVEGASDGSAPLDTGVAAEATAEVAPALEPEPAQEPEASTAVEVDPMPSEPELAAGPTTDEVEPDGAAETTAHAGPVFDDDALTLDPRVTALGLTPDFGAAEAEAAALMTDGSDDGPAEEGPAFDEETIATRLAGLVPAAPATADLVQTRVLVSGLVSVASIAGFKRGLARLPGVESVSVSTGPDGEFVFLVSRSAAADLSSAITTMPGFSARVTSASVEDLEVLAHDPDVA